MKPLQNQENQNFEKQITKIFSNQQIICPFHPQKQLYYISLDINSTQFFQCSDCISQSQNPDQKTLDLNSFIEENQNKVIKNWPVYGDHKLNQNLENIFQSEIYLDNLQQKITTYFENLKLLIIKKINKIFELSQEQIKSLRNIRKQVISQYNQLSEKENIKQIIISQNEDVEKLKEIIQKVESNQNIYKQILEENVNNFEQLKLQIGFDGDKQINQNIQTVVDCFDFFIFKNVEDIKFKTKVENQEVKFELESQMNDTNESINQLIIQLMNQHQNKCYDQSSDIFKKLVEKISIIANYKLNFKNDLNKDLLRKLKNKDVFLDTSQFLEEIDLSKNKHNKEILMKLVSNKFNNCSPKFLIDLSNSLDNIVLLINRIDVSNYLLSNEQFVRGEKLTQSQFQEISKLIKDIEESNQQIHDNQIQGQESQQKIQSLIQLFENKTNFCDDQFIQNAKEVTTNYQQITSFLFLKQKIFKENRSKPIDFSTFSGQQIDNLENLVNKISELSLKFGSNYLDNQSPNKHQQYYSKLASSLLGNINIINKLFVDFPILETIQLNSLKLRVDFLRVNLADSQQLILEKQQNDNYLIKIPKSKVGQIISQGKLDGCLNYIFRCKLNTFLNQNRIMFGIMKTSDANSSWVGKENSCFYNDSKEYGLNEIIRGKNLYEVRDSINQVEIRVNVEKRIVLFMDYPFYNNVNQMNYENITLNTDYSFAIFVYGEHQDYEIEIETSTQQDIFFKIFE